MLALEGVLLVGYDWFEELPPLVDCDLGRDFISIASVSFLLAWKDTFGALYRLLGSGLTFFCFNLNDDLLCLLALLYQLLLGTTLIHAYLN